jgi:hypothetical protein
MAQMLEGPSFQPSAALAAYAEPLVLGHAVIVFGDAGSGVGERLLQRGARTVHIYDRNAARAAEALARNTSNRVTIAALGDGGVALREAAFDVALVEDLGAVGDSAGLLRSLRRALSARGVALIATPNPDVRVRLLPSQPPSAASVAFDYYGLYDAVSEQFEHVRMLGQTPFVGYAVVDFAPEEEPSPTLDTDFVSGGAEQPEWYVALAASRPQSLSEFMLVQLPFESAVSGSASRRLEEQLHAAQASERRARSRVADLEAECAKLRAARAPEPEASHESLYKALEQRDNWIAQLEARALTADTRADEAQAELDSAQSRVAELEAEVAHARTEVARLQAERAGVTDEKQRLLSDLEALRHVLEEQRALRNQLEGELASRDARWTENAESAEQEAARELATLEEQLRSRAAEIQRLQHELREAERIGRELVGELGMNDGVQRVERASDTEDLGAKLDALAASTAQREADLTAARWTIDKLESRLEELEEAARSHPPAAALEEELARAQAALQRQQVLLEQARGEGGAPTSPDNYGPALTKTEERSLTE